MRNVTKAMVGVFFAGGLSACVSTTESSNPVADAAGGLWGLTKTVATNPIATGKATFHFFNEPLLKTLVVTTAATEETVIRYGAALSTIADAMEIKHTKLTENLQDLVEVKRAGGKLTDGLEAAVRVAESSSELSDDVANAVAARFETLDPEVQQKVVLASQQLVVADEIYVFSVVGMSFVGKRMADGDLAGLKNELLPIIQQGLLDDSIAAFAKLPKTFASVLENLSKPVEARGKMEEVSDISDQLADRDTLLEKQAAERIDAFKTGIPEKFVMTEDDPAFKLLQGLSVSQAAPLLDPYRNEEDAKTVQAALKKRGFYRGAIDGDFGRGSKRALRAFKKASGLADNDDWNSEIQEALLGS